MLFYGERARPLPTRGAAHLFVIRHRPSHVHGLTALGLLAGVLAVLALALPGVASAARTKVVRYHGYRATVPAQWPVIRLASHPHACVRFDRHAVYLGRPGARQNCPAHAAGRTESVLVAPERISTHPSADVAGPTTALSGAPTVGAVAQVTKPRAGVVVTATWRRHRATVRGALGVRSVRAAQRRSAGRAVAAQRAARARARHARRAASGPIADVGAAGFPTGVAPAGAPGNVFTGLGFDACSAPSENAMNDWLSSPFRAAGVYIGGANMACSQSNLTATWVSDVTTAGWHLIPIYVGLQAPGNGCGCAAISPAIAATQGTAAADDAIAEAQALGLGAGNPIYFDMENYSRTATATEAVLSFLSGWTGELHLQGYASGVYSSELSGMVDLVGQSGTTYAEPDDIWIANWNGAQSTDDGKVPATEWADHQRLHQYRGGHTDDYGGANISIDSDYVDAATAAPGSGGLTTTIADAPSVKVKPQADGTIDLYPSWSGEPNIDRWQISTGNSPTALAPTITVHTSARKPIVSRNAYGYFQVSALDAQGQPVGTSGTVATPAHVAMFGTDVFVPRHGRGGLPVECYGIPSCKVRATIRDAARRLVTTRPQRVASGGGIVHFPLTGRAHKMLAAAGSKGVAATITLHTTGGHMARRPMTLVPFSMTGAAPRSAPAAGTGLRIIGATQFVGGGWHGGVLVACTQSSPCAATPQVTSPTGGALATARAQTIGAGEIGYLHFRMNATGHAKLHRARTRGYNQVPAKITVTSTGDGGLSAGPSASALVSLSVF